jgi:phosphoenolpyruvate-protein phosphotransferase (PTS system enzyme I)
VSLHREGISAAPGIVIGPARVLRWEVPTVPHGGTIAPDQVEVEVQRLLDACAWAKERIREVQERTREQMGEVEAQIFEPQLLMLEDADLVGGAISYIRENQLGAARAFEWRVLEWEAQWSHTAHPMVLDKLNDLADVQARVLRRLLGLSDPDLHSVTREERAILVARDLTPSLTAQLDASRVMGVITDAGTRTSHCSILSRSLNIPTVVGLGSVSEEVRDGQMLILDGRTGRVIIDPTEEEIARYRERDFLIREWEQELMLLAHLEPVTLDGVRIPLRANIDLPGEIENALDHGAEGVGLFRTEFLVVGRSAVPGEQDQYLAYRRVTEYFAPDPVVIRTYDLGGDKFPAFLHLPAEENPFLGWRAIRLCLDQPALFRAQLRAILRAMPHGDLRVMIPLVNDISEVLRTRELMEECAAELRSEGHAIPERYLLGAMIETPAAALIAGELARHVDFFSVGTNDLVQYTLAVDRGNMRLAALFQPFHPAVLRLLAAAVKAGREAGIEVGVCGELAASPLGAFLLIGLGADTLSVGASSLAEIKKVIRSVSRDEAAAAVEEALRCASAEEVVRVLTAAVPDSLDLSLFASD